MYMLYGTAGTQIYLVQTYGSATRIEQRAVLIDNSRREFERQCVGSAWSAWRELPTFTYAPNSLTLIVDGENGDDSTAKGTEALPYKTIQAALNAVPVFFVNVTVSIKPGTYQESVSLTTLHIGRVLTIKSFSGQKDVTITYGNSGIFMDLENLYLLLSISELKFISVDASMGKTGAYLVQIHNVNVSNCEFEGFTLGEKSCVLFWNCFSASVSNSIFRKAGYGLRMLSCANTLSKSNTSDGNLEYGLRAEDGVIRRVGTQPTGTIANTVIIGGGQILP
jgi:hypothetical protein